MCLELETKMRSPASARSGALTARNSKASLGVDGGHEVAEIKGPRWVTTSESEKFNLFIALLTAFGGRRHVTSPMLPSCFSGLFFRLVFSGRLL